jgi:dephospho-CoA kinase
LSNKQAYNLPANVLIPSGPRVGMKKTLKIGLTGGIGSGKSLVLKLLAQRGIPVIQTDIIGHQLLKKKTFKRELTRRFGKSILDSQGRVDRSKLALLVFSDPRKRNQLNALSHPLIRQEVARWIRSQEKKACPVVVVEVPLLFERGYFRSFDRVLSVSAPRFVRRGRLLKRGWNSKEILRREKFQWPQRKKNKAADWVIFNQGTQKDLKYAVDQWLLKLH